MPGGLEGRLLREQIKSQRLNNMQQAQSLAGAQQLLQEAGMAESLLGQAQSREQSAQAFPTELQGQQLNNQAQQYSNSIAPEQHQMAQQTAQANNEQTGLENIFAGKRNDNYESDRSHKMNIENQELDLRKGGLEYAKTNSDVGLLNTAAAAGKPT